MTYYVVSFWAVGSLYPEGNPGQAETYEYTEAVILQEALTSRGYRATISQVEYTR